MSPLNTVGIAGVKHRNSGDNRTVPLSPQLGQIVQRIIGVADAVIIVFSGDLVFDHPLGQIIIVAGGNASVRIYDLGNSGDNSPVPLSLVIPDQAQMNI